MQQVGPLIAMGKPEEGWVDAAAATAVGVIKIEAGRSGSVEVVIAGVGKALMV